MTLSFAGTRRIPTPSLVPQSNPSPVSAPSHDGNPIPTPPSPHWALKVSMDQDTHRLPLLCSGAPTYHDVITGVGILFNLAPSDLASRPALFYRDFEGDTCTLTSTTYHDALPLFSSNHIIRLSLAATHSADARPSTIGSNIDPPCPEHHPKHTSRYLPPAHTIAGLMRDQTRKKENHRSDHEDAIAQWRSTHQSNPCSPSALRSLHELFHDDSSGGLNVLRSCLKVPTSRPHSQNATALRSSGSPSLSTESPPRQCLVPGTWPADEVLSAAKWIFGNPGLDWSPTPGAGGHKQIRIKFGIINHWNSGSSMFKGGTPGWCPINSFPRAILLPPPLPTPDSAWIPSSRRRKRYTSSSDTLDFPTDCRSPPATPPIATSPQRIPLNVSPFSVLSQHNLDQLGASPVPIQPLVQRSPRRSTVMESVSPVSSGTRTRAPSLTCSPSSGTGASHGSLLHTFFSLAPLVSSCVCIIFLLALSAVCYPVFAKHPFARKSRTGGRHRCRRYSSQLAHRRGAGGRSLCLESFGNRSPVRSLWKRSLFWVSRLVHAAIVVLLPIALSLSWSGCHSGFSFFQLGSCFWSRCPVVDALDISAPVSAHHLANISDRSCHFLVSTGCIFHVGTSLADFHASLDPSQPQTTFEAAFCFGPTGAPGLARDQLAMRISRYQSG